MAVAGQRPTPGHLKLIDGTAEKRGIATDREPVPDGDVVKPKFVKGRASEIWDQYAPMVLKLGMLTALDVHNFGAWCRLAVMVERGGDKLTGSLLTQFRVMGEGFGIGGAARARIGLDLGKHAKRDGAKANEETQGAAKSRWFKD